MAEYAGAHMRDVRGELILKLGLLARLGESADDLVRDQVRAFEPMIAGLEARAAGDTQTVEFDVTLARWRLESARVVMRFLEGLPTAAAR